jgi:membrane fusion protein
MSSCFSSLKWIARALMKTNHLFRSAVLDNRRSKWLGDVILTRPLSFSVLSISAACCALVVLLFLWLGSYTKRSTVMGQLVPDSGLIKITPQQAGIVSQKLVSEGQQVVQGQVLLVLSSQRRDVDGADTQAAISTRIAERQASLEEELRKTERLQRDGRAALVKNIDGLINELNKIGSQLDGQITRVKLADEAVARAQQLVATNFISREQLQQKQAELLDQYNRQQSLERDQITIQRELAAQRDDLASLPLRAENELAQLRRVINSSIQELTESEAKRSFAITAPESGIVTAIAVERGQVVEPGKPMMSLVPANARLRAELYVPSRAIGFIRAGSPVLLRYQAFPYQKFGHGRGEVSTVSKTTLPIGELNALAASHGNGEPLYKITVDLAAQSMRAYGKAELLQAGMLLEADVLQETRRLYEWVLEPLYSITGKI